MTMQRKNPVPAGRYWIDVFQQKIPMFESWLARNKDLITVEQRTPFGEVYGFSAYRVWYLFTVKSTPGPIFPQRIFGYPTFADAQIKTADDTAKLPPPVPGPGTMIADFFDDIKTGAIVIGLFWLFLEATSKGKK